MYCGALERILSIMSCCVRVQSNSLPIEVRTVVFVVEVGGYQSLAVSRQRRIASCILVG